MSTVDDRLAALTIEEKSRIAVGATNWSTHPVERLAIPAVKMSDGPNGVRGEGFGATRTPGISVPVGIALGASWDPNLVERVGRLLGEEAIRKRAHVLLGPTVNLHRTPIGGRTFECYSEDGELSAALAVAFVRGVQSRDVAVTVKHFAANDTEIDRFSVDAIVDERTLREHYLRPFEAAVIDGGAWGIMSAYNKLDGAHCAENRMLLTEILREDWGFDGFVVSDWFGAHDTVGAAQAGLSIEMPAPARVYGARLAEAVESGAVAEADLDRIARDVLVLIERTRADDRSADEAEESVDDPGERALCRRAAVAGTVLLRNEGRSLPLDAAAMARIAVIGPNAVMDRSQGGGSASLTALSQRTFLDAFRERLPDVDVSYEPGVRIDRLTPVVLADQLRSPDGRPGMELEYSSGPDPDGPVEVSGRVTSSIVTFFGSTPPGVDAASFSFRAIAEFVPLADGPHEIGVVTTGGCRVVAGDVVVVDDPDRLLPRGEHFFGFGTEEQIATIDCRAGEPVPLELRWSGGETIGFGALRVGIRQPDPPDLFDRAVAAAAAADVAVVMVGTTEEWETEGNDRTTMALPGEQDRLVSAVAAANPNTVVIVNAGAPVEMPWVQEVPAVLTPFFAGMEQAEALVDVVLGVADPGGRLPITFPVRLEDAPAMAHYRPVDGVQRYDEGWAFGYRGHEVTGIAPLFPFGHGLSYGRVDWGDPEANATAMTAAELDETGFEITVALRNQDTRDGTVVVQAYVCPIDPPVDRAPRQLAAWDRLVVPAGDVAVARLALGPVAFRRWSPEAHAWVVDPGRYDIVVGASATEDRARVAVEITADPVGPDER